MDTYRALFLPQSPLHSLLTFATLGVVKIWRYKRLIAQRRVKAGLPELYDPDDLPDPVYDPNYVHVLTEKEQIDLHYRAYIILAYTYLHTH